MSLYKAIFIKGLFLKKHNIETKFCATLLFYFLIRSFIENSFALFSIDFLLVIMSISIVKEFINKSANELGFSIEWKGKNFNEKGYVKSIFKKINKNCQLKSGQLIVKVDKKYFRPLDVNELRGDSSKAKKILQWKPKIKIESLIKEMVHHDFSLARNSYLIKNINEKKE